MRHILIIILSMLLRTTKVLAVPAQPGGQRVTLPDGTSIYVVLHGDEYLSYTTTADGYSVVRCDDGFYAYAQRDTQGQLLPTDRRAHDAGERTADEQAWLMGVQKHLMPAMTATMATERQAEQARRAQAREAARAAKYDYSKFRGLIILVEYNDKPFSRPDYAQIVDDMANAENYKGYDNTTLGKFTGSLRDYFCDNSNGIFIPHFDVVGPIQVDFSQYDAKKTDNVRPITTAALLAADSLVDFTQYDTDNNGRVDMVYFIFSGNGSNVGGNDQRLIWPHASYIYTMNEQGRLSYMYLDGMCMDRYACSTELTNSQQKPIIDGIGTICHEFSHVLGLPDFYDTDYEENGYSLTTPDDWSVMSGGSYLNYSRTPAGYTLFERYALGFAYPTLISEPGQQTLGILGETNTGYRINSKVRNEYFLFENRQRTSKWDAQLPGHGMLVYRVDSTNAQVWRSNQVNANPKHTYFDLVRAVASSQGNAQASDPFPGTGRVTSLNNVTKPGNLLSWSGQPTPLGLENIQETSNGRIVFDVIDVSKLTSISLPEQMTLGVGLKTRLVETRLPDYAPYTLKWTSSNEKVATVDANGYVSGIAKGVADITVVANDDPALTATCHVTVEETTQTATVAAFAALSDGQEAVLMLNNALVVYRYGNNVYVRDASGAIVFADTGLELAVGDLLNGFVFGKKALVNGMPTLQKVDQRTDANGYTRSSGNEVKPREVSISEMGTSYYADLVTLKSVHIDKTGGVWAWYNDMKVQVLNSFSLPSKNLVPASPGTGYYEVTGIVMPSTSANVPHAISLTAKIVKGSEPVEEAPTAANIAAFNALEAGKVAKMTLTNALVVYVHGTDAYVRDATGAVVFSATGLELAVGDQLNGYVYGQRTSQNGLPMLTKVNQRTSDAGYTRISGNEVKPVELTINQMGTAHYADLVTLKSVHIDKTGGVWAWYNDLKVQVLNSFGLPSKNLVPATTGESFFDATGIALPAAATSGVSHALSLTTKVVKGTAPSAIAPLTANEQQANEAVTVYTADGRYVAQTTIGTLATMELRKGVYIVRTGNRAWRIVK